MIDMILARTMIPSLLRYSTPSYFFVLPISSEAQSQQGQVHSKVEQTKSWTSIEHLSMKSTKT